jgi:hypothetical protein
VSEASDDRLKRLFAQAPRVEADEGFVVQVAGDVATRRGRLRARRMALVLLFCMAGLGLAFVLAPLALTDSVSGAGGSMLGLPEKLGVAADSVRSSPAVLYLGIALAAIVLPLAGAAWLSRRA